jgi:hypothetical protein
VSVTGGAALGKELEDWFPSLGGRSLVIGQAIDDVDGRYKAWFADHGVVAVIQRPDFHIYGTAAMETEVEALVGVSGSHWDPDAGPAVRKIGIWMGSGSSDPEPIRTLQTSPQAPVRESEPRTGALTSWRQDPVAASRCTRRP